MKTEVTSMTARSANVAAVLILASTVLGGCGDASDDSGGEDGVSVQLGVADSNGTGYSTVDDGTEVTLIPGSQGGFHVWINMRLYGVTDSAWIEVEARRLRDMALVFRGLPRRVVVSGSEPTLEDDAWESPVGIPAFMCPSPLGIQVFDEELQFSIYVLDEEDQRVAEDHLILIPHCPDGDSAEFCRDICAG